MKKLLTSLMGVSLITSTTASVVACGSKDPEHTLKLGYNTIVSNWNTAKTMSQEDHYILSNTNSTPLGSDQYGRQYGDLFELTNQSYGKNNPYIGITPDDENEYKEFTYKLRENATWSDWKGKKIADIQVNDFINTAKYVLNSANASALSSLWTSFIKGAAEIVKLQTNKENPISFDAAWDQKGKDLGIKVNETTRTVKFELIKKASYFETLLTYSVFSPIHENVLNNEITNRDFKKAYFSGPFIPTKFKNQQDIVLDKNENYHLKEDTKLNRLRFKWAVGGVDKARTLFESGAIDQFKPAVSDTSGWDKYVGDKPKTEPKATDGLSWTEESPDDATSFSWMFNINNSNYTSDSSDKARALAAGRALQNKEVRKFISTNLDRSTYISYSSKAFDEPDQPSSMIRNTYTPDYDIETSSTTYWDHMANALNKSGIENMPTDLKKEDIKDGVDFLYGRKDTIWNKGGENLKKVNDYFDGDEKIKAGMIDGKLTIYVPIHPSTKNTSEPYQLLMMEEFNKIPENPIKIEQINIRDQNEFTDIMNAGAYDILNLGWTWDFQDAYSYLATFKIGGDLNVYVGTTRMFPDLNASNFQEEKFNEFKPEFVPDGSNKTSNLRDFIVEKDNITKDFYDELLKYSKAIDKIDKEESEDKRLELFAQQEMKMIYENFRIMPLNKRALPVDFTMTYATPFVLSTTAYGISRYKYWAIGTNTYLISAKEIAELKAAYEKNWNEVEEDPTKHQDTAAWKK